MVRVSVPPKTTPKVAKMRAEMQRRHDAAQRSGKIYGGHGGDGNNQGRDAKLSTVVHQRQPTDSS